MIPGGAESSKQWEYNRSLNLRSEVHALFLTIVKLYQARVGSVERLRRAV